MYDGLVTDRSELEALRTRVANQAASLAETVSQGFDEFHMGAADYVVDLSVPEGPSTGGGAQARQNIRLVPRRKGYAIVSPREKWQWSGIVSFTSRSNNHEQIFQALRREHRTEIALREGRLRASPHFYNTEAQIDRLIEHLPVG